MFISGGGHFSDVIMLLSLSGRNNFLPFSFQYEYLKILFFHRLNLNRAFVAFSHFFFGICFWLKAKDMSHWRNSFEILVLRLIEKK